MASYSPFSTFFLHGFRQKLRQKFILLSLTSWLLAGSGFSGGAIAPVKAIETDAPETDTLETDTLETDAPGTQQSQLQDQEIERSQEWAQDVQPHWNEGGSSQTADTLSFSTDRYSVRVYRQNNQLLMDVYDLQSQRYLLQRNLTALNSPGAWRTYRSVQGNLEVYARSNQNGNTELEILSGGQQFYFGQGSPGTGNPSLPDNGNPSASSALLSFDTNDYRTRVYRLNSQVFMDVADVRTSTFLMRQAPTAIAPQQQTTVASRTYAATQGPYQAFASVSSNRATELQLWSNGSQVYRANGFNPSGSDIGFNDSPSTGYMGNDFAVPTQAQITTRSANLRDRPSTTSSAVVATLLQCTQVTVTQKQYNTGDRYVWYFIDIRGQARGWIRGDLINTDVPSC